MFIDMENLFPVTEAFPISFDILSSSVTDAINCPEDGEFLIARRDEAGNALLIKPLISRITVRPATVSGLLNISSVRFTRGAEIMAPIFEFPRQPEIDMIAVNANMRIKHLVAKFRLPAINTAFRDG